MGVLNKILSKISHMGNKPKKGQSVPEQQAPATAGSPAMTAAPAAQPMMEPAPQISGLADSPSIGEVDASDELALPGA